MEGWIIPEPFLSTRYSKAYRLTEECKSMLVGAHLFDAASKVRSILRKYFFVLEYEPLDVNNPKYIFSFYKETLFTDQVFNEFVSEMEDALLMNERGEYRTYGEHRDHILKRAEVRRKFILEIWNI